MELTLKALTGHLGPRPTFPRSGESREEFVLRRLAWRQAYRLFTARHRAERRLLRRDTLRERSAIVLAPEPVVERARATSVPGPPELPYGAHPLRMHPPLTRPLPIAQRVAHTSPGDGLCARRSRPARRRTPPA